MPPSSHKMHLSNDEVAILSGKKFSFGLTFSMGTYLDVVAKLKSEGSKFKVPTTLNPRVNIKTSWTDLYWLIEKGFLL